MQKADHSGHRARMKKKLREQGIGVFEPHEVLEILLYYAIPYRDTNDVAKRLIDRFGSLSAVLDAPEEALIREGLTEHQALFLKMIPDVTRLYMMDKHESPDKVIDLFNLPAYITDRFIGLEHTERVLLMLFDQKGKMVYSGIISDGDFDSASISTRSIVTLALNYAATAVVLAHNHPSGIALPSKSDIVTTMRLKDVLTPLGINLLDHYIVADHDCVSMAESGIFSALKKEDYSE